MFFMDALTQHLSERALREMRYLPDAAGFDGNDDCPCPSDGCNEVFQKVRGVACDLRACVIWM